MDVHTHQNQPNKKTRWIIKMNRRFENDHERIQSAFRNSLDFKNFALAKKYFSQCDYVNMNHHIELMEKNCADFTRYTQDMLPSNTEEEEDTVDTPPVSVVQREEVRDEEFVDLSEFVIRHYDKHHDDLSLMFKQSVKKIPSEDVSSTSDDSSSQENDLPDVTPSTSRRAGKTHHKFGEFKGVPKVERRNLVTSNLRVELVENMDDKRFELCDPATCVDCKALLYPNLPKIMRDSVIVYAGPGSGKTESIKELRRRYGFRITIRDTDHMKIGDIVPSRSILFTNRPDVLMNYDGIKIAFLPYRRHWIQQCSSKCPGTMDSWYDDVVNLLRDCVLVRRNCYLSECISFAM